MTGLKQDWGLTAAELDGQGWSVLPGLLNGADCDRIAASYDRDELFRSRVVMARHGYGQGEYRYFAYPLPPVVAALRRGLYRRLAGIANRWSAALGLDRRFPEDHAEYLKLCHEAGQTRPTPLVLKYGPGDYNRLHQDLYGELVFPLQLTVLLSADFTGGEFVLTEQRVRMQSRA